MLITIFDYLLLIIYHDYCLIEKLIEIVASLLPNSFAEFAELFKISQNLILCMYIFFILAERVA